MTHRLVPGAVFVEETTKRQAFIPGSVYGNLASTLESIGIPTAAEVEFGTFGFQTNAVRPSSHVANVLFSADMRVGAGSAGTGHFFAILSAIGG